MKAAISEGPNQAPQEEQLELRRGPWTLEEDTLLIHSIACQGEGRWNSLAKSAGLKRTGKSCRLRWLNYLKPDIKRGNLTPQEQLLILELNSKWGNRWSKIAQHLPGRTDNEIKNYWRTRVQKQARKLNMEPNSQRFIDTIRCFYMPRLVQKIEQNTSSSCSSSQTNKTTMVQHTAEGNSSNSNSSLSSISSLMPEISSFQLSPSAVFEEVVYTKGNNSSLQDGCYYMEPDLGPLDGVFPDNRWVSNDLAEDMWSLDELWQFRK